MDSPHLSLLRRSTAVFVLAGYLSLAAVPQIGPAILIIPVVALAFARMGESLDANHKAYGVISRGVTVAYFCFLPLSWAKLDLLPTVVVLVIYIQCYTLVHVKNARNYYHLFLMSLFLLLAACVLSPDPIIGLILLVFLVSAVWANMALRIVVEETACSRLPEVELVSLDNMLHHAYREGPSQSRSSMPLAASSLSLGAIVLTATWFLLTPRLEAGILGRNQIEAQVTGVSDSVDLSEGGAISEDQTPVMLVQLPDEPNGQIGNLDWLYWRVTTHNTYGNNRWENRAVRLLDPGENNLVSNSRNSISSPTRVERYKRPGAKTVRQIIYMDNVPRSGVPALDLVQQISVSENTKGVELLWERENDFTVRLNTPSSRRLNYEAWSEVGDPSPEELRKAPFDFEYVSESDLDTLTICPLSDESIALASSIADNQPTLYDRVAAIEAYLSGPDFLYSLENPATSAASVIDDFILNTRLGHCEKFATAMALMVRSQGIPARVVSGFRGGEWNESDQSYTIRANMAHLWVEVWFPTAGWVVFDPSPRADDQPLSQFGQIARLASRVMLKSKMFWFREVVGFDRAAQVDRLRNFSLGVIQGLRGQAEGSDEAQTSGTLSRLGAATPFIVFFVILGTVTYALYRIRWIPVPRNRALTREQVRVVRLYLLLRRRLNKFGVVCAGKTAEELREELHAPRWGSPETAMEVIELYNTVRFGCRPASGTDFPQLRRAILGLRPRET